MGQDRVEQAKVQQAQQVQQVQDRVEQAKVQQAQQVQQVQAAALEKDNSRAPSPGNDALDKALAEMQQQFKDVDCAHTKLSKDINSIQAWLEASFPLSVVRASRVAILSLDLTTQERQTALAQLETKEKQLTAEMERLS